MTRFVGYTERIINSIPDEHGAENKKSLAFGQDKLPIERALGVIWCIESDTFNFRIELKDKPCTRRGILSGISFIYDPLGFTAPVEWIKGPDFLKEPVESWLKEETYEDHVDSESPEVKNVKVNISTVKQSSNIVKKL